jgi:alcohol dehydrogenase, propanol-preferring
MSEIPAFPYDILWGERSVRSVANLTRQDGEEFLALAPRIPVQIEVQRYELADLNRAIGELRDGQVVGAAVIEVRARPG